MHPKVPQGFGHAQRHAAVSVGKVPQAFGHFQRNCIPKSLRDLAMSSATLRWMWANSLARTNQTATIQLLLAQLERHEDGRIATDDEHLRSQVDQCRPDVFTYVSCCRYGSVSSALPIASSESRPRYPVRADPCLPA